MPVLFFSKRLFRGSWGSVFRAYNTQKKNFVAIKRVSKNNSRVNMEIETQKEASKHPAIIELFDAFSTAKVKNKIALDSSSTL